MEKQPLIIGIDLTNEYCQASYYNERRGRSESVMTGTAVMRYLIPMVMCRNSEDGKWVIGEAAMQLSETKHCPAYKNLLRGMMFSDSVDIAGEKYSYEKLMAIFLSSLLDIVCVYTGISRIENITVTVSKTGKDMHEHLKAVFSLMDFDFSKVCIQSYSESFAYYLMNEDESLWADGALMFDFDNDGFHVRKLSVNASGAKPVVIVEEKGFSSEFGIRDLASEMQRIQLDKRLGDIYDSMRPQGIRCSVYFTGVGFTQTWFSNSLAKISENCRVFKGNNLCAKGACLTGYSASTGNGRCYPVISRGKTKAEIAVLCRVRGEVRQLPLLKAAENWYDSFCSRDFILTEDKRADVVVTSLITSERQQLEFDLSQFPDRPDKACRVRVDVVYANDSQVEITMTDMGFGSFFESSGKTVRKRINLEGLN